VVLKLSFLFLDGDAGPVPDKLVRAGQRVEKRCLAAVRVAGKRDFNRYIASSSQALWNIPRY